MCEMFFVVRVCVLFSDTRLSIRYGVISHYYITTTKKIRQSPWRDEVAETIQDGFFVTFAGGWHAEERNTSRVVR